MTNVKPPQLVSNTAGCVATNSVHVDNTGPGESFRVMQKGFGSTLTRLSCEVEGHPLGGGAALRGWRGYA